MANKKRKLLNKKQNKSNMIKKAAGITAVMLIILAAGILIFNNYNSSSNNSDDVAVTTEESQETTNETDGASNAVTDEESQETGSVAEDANNEDLVINISDITGTQVKFYPVRINNTKMEVLAVKAPDGTVRTAFNTCQVCFGSGRGYYVQQGSTLVCQNCSNRFVFDDIEKIRGGCNPVAITSENKTVNENTITISKEFLSEMSQIFKNWKN